MSGKSSIVKMKEEKRDKFLISIGEEINKNKKYVNSSTFKTDDKVIKEVEINDKKMKLSYVYANTLNLRNCLIQGTEMATKGLIDYNLEVPQLGKKCFDTFKTYMKDIVNLCYFDIDLNEKHMDLIYSMINNFLVETNNELISVGNDYFGQLQKLDESFAKSDRNIKSREMNEYLNSPTIVSTNSVDSIWGNSTTIYGSATKLGKAPTGETNPFLIQWHNDDVRKATKDALKNVYEKIVDIFNRFNEQLVNLLIEKREDLFTTEDYTNTDKWIECISKSSEKELSDICECVTCYNINLKDVIETLVVNNSVVGKETNNNLLEFYKLINDSKEIDVSSQIVDVLSKNVTKKINKLDDLSEKDELVKKEIKKLESIPYLKEDDKIVVINNINKQAKKQEEIINEEISVYKRSKRNKIIKIALIVLPILVLIGFMIYSKEFLADVLMVVIGLGVLYIMYRIFKKIFF